MVRLYATLALRAEYAESSIDALAHAFQDTARLNLTLADGHGRLPIRQLLFYLLEKSLSPTEKAAIQRQVLKGPLLRDDLIQTAALSEWPIAEENTSLLRNCARGGESLCLKALAKLRDPADVALLKSVYQYHPERALEAIALHGHPSFGAFLDREAETWISDGSAASLRLFLSAVAAVGDKSAVRILQSSFEISGGIRVPSGRQTTLWVISENPDTVFLDLAFQLWERDDLVSQATWQLVSTQNPARTEELLRWKLGTVLESDTGPNMVLIGTPIERVRTKPPSTLQIIEFLQARLGEAAIALLEDAARTAHPRRLPQLIDPLIESGRESAIAILKERLQDEAMGMASNAIIDALMKLDRPDIHEFLVEITDKQFAEAVEEAEERQNN